MHLPTSWVSFFWKIRRLCFTGYWFRRIWEHWWLVVVHEVLEQLFLISLIEQMSFCLMLPMEFGKWLLLWNTVLIFRSFRRQLYFHLAARLYEQFYSSFCIFWIGFSNKCHLFLDLWCVNGSLNRQYCWIFCIFLDLVFSILFGSLCEQIFHLPEGSCIFMVLIQYFPRDRI